MSTWVWFVLGAFLSGSVPWGLIISKWHGVDIRQHGSKNIGATNVFRVLGRKAGILCFVLDVLKGLAPTLVAGLFHGVAGSWMVDGSQAWWWVAVMAAAILGHMYSPWVGFKGGKGVATGLGALAGVWPILGVPGLVAFGLWIVVFKVTRYVSLASITAALSLPMLVAAQFLLVRNGQVGTSWRGLMPFLLVTGVLAGLVVWRHRTNVKRLLAGQELRVGRKQPG